MLVDVPAGESPAEGDCPVALVVISGGGRGDPTVESPEVKVSVGWTGNEGPLPGGLKDSGLSTLAKCPVRSIREASKSAGCSESELIAPKVDAAYEMDGAGFRECRVGTWMTKASADDEGTGCMQSSGSPGWVQDDMPTRNVQRKHGTSRGSPRPKGTAKAPRITSCAGKSGRAREWGGWGRLSVDGPGQNNPDRSEGPWGRVARAAQMAASHRTEDSTPSEPPSLVTDDAKDGRKPGDAVMRRHQGRPRLKSRP